MTRTEIINQIFENKNLVFANPEIQIVTFLIIIICCFIIFYKTKEYYDLTGNKGINFFRKGFLFLGLGSLTGLIGFVIKNNIVEFNINWQFFIVFLIVFQLIGLFYLFASMYSDKINKEWPYFLSIMSIVLITFIIQNPMILFLFQALLFLSIGIVSYRRLKSQEKKKNSQIYITYLLLFGFWIFQVIGFNLRNIAYSKEIAAIFGAILFIYMTIRVLKKIIK